MRIVGVLELIIDLWDYCMVNLVSCIAILEGGMDLFISTCSPSIAMLNAPQFHDIYLWLSLYVGCYVDVRLDILIWGWGW